MVLNRDELCGSCVTVVDTLRDHRLRHFYEARYDYRNNLIDWDYTVSFELGWLTLSNWLF